MALNALERLRLTKELSGLRTEADSLGAGPAAAVKKLKIAKSIREIRQQLGLGSAKPEENPVVSLTGKELGDFPDTEEGKKALRAAAKASLLSLRGKMVTCPILGEPVEIRKRGIKETMRFSANPDKLKMIAAIESIIGSASEKSWEENYKKEDKPYIEGYFTLKSRVSVEDRAFVVDVLIEKDGNGVFHYDLIIDREKTKTALDSASGAASVARRSPDHKSGHSGDPNVVEGAQEVNLALDSASGRMVLNLFIEGEPPELVEDDESAEVATLRKIAAGGMDGSGEPLDVLKALYDDIAGAVNALNDAGLLTGEAEDAANAAITHWAELEERLNG